MLILFFIISLSCPLFNGMDQNDVEVQNACCTSCWNHFGNICPQNCWDFHLGECINDCWNNFCNYCNNRFFWNQNATQSDDQYQGEEECEEEDDEDGGEGEFQEENQDTEGQWQDYDCEAQVQHQYTERESDFMPSSYGETSYHYGSYDEDIHQSHQYNEEATDWENQPSSSQTGGMPYYNSWDDDLTDQVENLSEHIQNIKLKGYKFYYFIIKIIFNENFIIEEDLIVQHEALQGCLITL
ncbi:unnamed protein product [Meloidogyne enterolobii]|uniref:Uncharacterized protein n=1 Tax=Meloidogyne enterolobii TaxID=390850 RepID=A0ACB1AWX4_MELEN